MEELTDHEIGELARLLPSLQRASEVLAEAGFPAEFVPDGRHDSASFWRLVGDAVADGVMHAGRTRLLQAALRRYPANRIFAAAGSATLPATGVGRDSFHTEVRAERGSSVTFVVQGDLDAGARRGAPQTPAGPTLRVLFVGASPFDLELDRIRADREFSAIRRAAPEGLLWVGARPAAAAGDLADVLDVRPDVLHLCCHGDDATLIFEDPEGEAHHVPVDTVVNRLRGYHDDANLDLRAIVLSVCRSADIAARFTPLADTVIAWLGDLDDDCAVDFAGQFYRAAVRYPPPTLASAARIAAREVAQPPQIGQPPQVGRPQRCANLADQLVVLSR